MYANCAVWVGGTGGPENDFSLMWMDSPHKKGQFFGWGIRQRNLTYIKSMWHCGVKCGCYSVPAAE